MSEVSKIAWTDSTFNPWIGCTKVGPGCDNCYAEAMDSRKRWEGKAHWGAGVPRYRTSQSNWAQPLKWNKKAAASGKGHRVFCASLADVFDNEVPQQWRNELFSLIFATPHLSWLLVTKRIGNVKHMMPTAWLLDGEMPNNVRLMITVCNQEEADRDIPKLLALPCKNGISYEPALGSVDWSPYLGGGTRPQDFSLRYINWIIVGGESGSKARPFDLSWARSTIAQCKAADVPVFMKQMGTCRFMWSDRAGADPAEWPEDLRVREFPA